jgi:hypothetical protein
MQPTLDDPVSNWQSAAFFLTVFGAGPITLLKRWLGHSRITHNGIYADARGPDEVGFAGPMDGQHLELSRK